MAMRFARVFLIAIVLSWKLNACVIRIMQVLPICGDGEEVWTVGYQNRTLQAVVHLDRCENTLLDFNWYQNGKQLAFVGYNNLATYAFAKWSLVNTSHMISTLEMNNTLNGSTRIMIFEMRCISANYEQYYENRTVFVKNCSHSLKDVSVISDNYTYGSKGQFKCSGGQVLVDTSKNQSVSNAETECSTCAQWENMKRMACWKKPSVKFKFNNKNQTHVSGANLTTDMCEVIDYGRPNGSVLLELNNSLWSSPITLKPYHNGLNIFCKMENQLTKILSVNDSNEGLVRSKPYTLSIKFGPFDVLSQKICVRTDEKRNLFNMTLKISFSANPPFGNMSLSIQDNALNFTIDASNKSVGCCGVKVQHYTIRVANVTSQDGITFIYEHAIKNYINTFSCADVSTTRPFVTTPVIIAVSGGILLIIAITVLCVLIKRRRKSVASQLALSQTSSPEEHSNRKLERSRILVIFYLEFTLPGQGSEERLSVLYDTTDIRSSGNAAESVENGLYGSASRTSGLYAAVVKPKNKGNSGESVENVLYGSATRETDVYAAVVKPKKKSEATVPDLYAEVVKIKKEKKDLSADGPSVSRFQSEATYAAVNKKQKSEKSGKQHKEVDESLQLDQTYAIVDKSREKK